MRLLVLWGKGGEEEHVKIVDMGKGKSWSVAVKPSCSPIHDVDHLLERRGPMRLEPRGLAVPPTGRLLHGRGSQLGPCLPSQVQL